MRKIILSAAVILALIMAMNIKQASSGQNSDLSKVSLFVHGKVYKFFDASTGRIYTYSAEDGKLISVWGVKRLGDNLEFVQGNAKPQADSY